MLGVGRDRDPGSTAAGGRRVTPAAPDASRPAVSELGLDEERAAWVLVNATEGVGPVSFARLLTAFGDARSVLAVALAPGGPARLVAASRGPDGSSPTLTPAAASGVAEAAGRPHRALGLVRRLGLQVVTLADASYPARLRRIDLPPPVLFVLGSVASLDRPRSVAIVGTRRPTSLGRTTAGQIADAVAALGATVVSGLALGIDAAAHVAALRSHAPTVAVIGGGHGHLYPAGHRRLAEAIAGSGGAIVSEFAPDIIPSRGTFPRRNRIISGLADATVVVEAGARSGALTTAAWALEQGRGLHIVPGRLDDPAVAGSLAFLREAGPEARIVAGIPELLDDLGLIAGPGPTDVTGDDGACRTGEPGAPARRFAAALASLSPPQRAIANAVAAGSGAVDELVATTGLPAAAVLGTLTALELRGLVVEVFGRYGPSGALAAGTRGPGATLAAGRRHRAQQAER